MSVRFILPPNEYGCVYAWTTLGNIAKLLFTILANKNHLFRWSSFWFWWVCKQSKLSHLGHRKPALIHWKDDAPKTSHCLVRILNFEKPLQSMAIFIGLCWTNFRSQKLKRRILDGATCQTVEATLDVLRPVFEDGIIRRRADVVWPPRSCDLTSLDYYLWGATKCKRYVDKPETIDFLKDNIREVIGEIQLHTIDNVLKNWTDRVGYCMAIRGSHLNEIIFHYYPEGLYFQIKKKFEKIFSSFV